MENSIKQGWLQSMYRFWPYITKPILDILKPHVVMEIGAADGQNTRHLLEFCQQNNAVLHSVDPAPDFLVADWQAEFGDHFVFHKELSLSAIPNIKSVDVVLIDGDHNWYTVYNELMEIKKVCEQENRPFPFTMFHDIGWPYARRDLYYDPDTIPEEYRKPYSKKGIVPDSVELVEEGGINANLYNADTEFLPQSGVLTAIEDFLKDNPQLDFMEIPGFHSFGLLYERTTRGKNSELDAFLRNLPAQLVANGFLAAVEAGRINLAVLRTNAEQRLRKERAKNAELSADVQRFLGWLKNLEAAFNALLESNRWKIGNKIGDLSMRLRGRQPEPLVTEYLYEVFDRLHQWEKSHTTADQQSVQKFPNIHVDIVICIHNALDDVKACIDSIRRHTESRHQLILVDDGSGEDCRKYLSKYASQHENVTLIRNESTSGYTIAANQGLRQSKAEYVILLNSDTVVTPNWIERILECGESNTQIGMVGPLSNAASWQSVPELFDSSKGWSVNPLPAGWTPDKMAEVVARNSYKEFPRVPLLNGFCLTIKRGVIEKIGYLDEQSFPEGYGEENDYCLRAVDSGFELAVADHAYIYHAKSKSYSHERRLVLSKKSGEILNQKHGKQRLDRDVTLMRQQPVLERMRKYVAQAIKSQASYKISSLAENSGEKSFGVLFILPVQGQGGGIHSIVQEAAAMYNMGVKVKIAVRESHYSSYEGNYPNIKNITDILVGINTDEELIKCASEFQVMVGTIYHSMELVNRVVAANPQLMPAYYIQDYEPLFFEKDTKQWKQAYQSYTLVKDAVLFAKTNWLCEVVEKEHHVHVDKVMPSLDHSVYYPSVTAARRANWPVIISAMIRPSSPRRGADRTMRVLKQIKKKYDQRVEIHLFGCKEQDFITYELESDFEYFSHGTLIREEVADLLRQSDIFVDYSDYQAFGRTGVEAMACGCAVIFPKEGGTRDFAINGENSLVINTRDEEACFTALDTLVENHDLRKKLRKNALDKVQEFSPLRAAQSELNLFTEKYTEFLATRTKGDEVKEASKNDTTELTVTGIVPLKAKGSVASAYIRLLQPLTHPSVKGKLAFKTGTVSDVYENPPYAVVVQRIAIKEEKDAHQLVNFCTSNGIKLVYEVDDDLFEIGSSGSSHPEAEKYAQWIRGARILALNADLVTVSSNNLKEKLSNMNQNIHVLPNALDEQTWQVGSVPISTGSSAEEQIGILYMGTKTHNQDLEIIKDALSLINKKYQNRVRFDIVGVSAEVADGKMFHVIDIPPETGEYPEFVRWMLKNASSWTIGLAPLAQTSFNECKSYIKYLDYSATGLVSICSNIAPYQEVITNWQNGVLVDNSTDAWYDALERLIEDSALRATIRENAYRGFLANHTLQTRAMDWWNVYSSLKPQGQ
jgi:GT2 family glycosyltransferase/glycosyltransferase involved in cell wall biosynthesis